MKVIFLARFLPQEGSTIHMYDLAKNLIDRGHDVHIISRGPKNDEGATKIFHEVINYGVQHHKVGFPLDTKYNLIGKMKQLIQYVLATPKALKILLDLEPEVIHVHYPVTSYIAKVYEKLKSKEFITTYHTTGVPKHPLHKKSNYVIAISKELEQELQEKFNYDKKQIKLIFNGVSLDRFKSSISIEEKFEIKQKLNIPKRKVLLGFVGRLTHLKGIDILLEALSKVKEDNYHLILVGDGDIEWVNSLIKKFYLEDKVSLYPFQNPIDFYEVFDIFVLPSRREGFGLVAIEAMMMATPVIRSDVGGAKEQIEQGSNGYIFKNEDTNELSKYIRILLEDEKLRENMGRKSKIKALDEFTLDTMVDKTLELYEVVK